MSWKHNPFSKVYSVLMLPSVISLAFFLAYTFELFFFFWVTPLPTSISKSTQTLIKERSCLGFLLFRAHSSPLPTPLSRQSPQQFPKSPVSPFLSCPLLSPHLLGRSQVPSQWNSPESLSRRSTPRLPYSSAFPHPEPEASSGPHSQVTVPPGALLHPPVWVSWARNQQAKASPGLQRHLCDGATMLPQVSSNPGVACDALEHLKEHCSLLWPMCT